MSYPLDAVVPAPVRHALAADPSIDDGFTILVLTLSSDWPHLALVSRGELLCTGERGLWLALWPTSTACANLRVTGRATLCAVLEGVAYSIRVRAHHGQDLSTPLAGTLATFALEVDSVRGDEAPYAVLESGITFRLRDPEPTVQRWSEVRAELARLHA
jgi:hypothetical protein